MERVTLKLAETSHLGREGQIVELSLTPTDVRIPEELPTYIAGYKPFAARADEISRPFGVDVEFGKLRNFTLLNTFQRVNVKTSSEGHVKEIDSATELLDYKTVLRAVGSYVSDHMSAQAQSRAAGQRRAAAKKCVRPMITDRELDVAALMQTAGNWATSAKVNLGATFNWNGGAASDPILDLHTRIEASSQEVTKIWMTRFVANTMLRHAKVIAYVAGLIGHNAIDMSIHNLNKANLAQVSHDILLPGFPPIGILASKSVDPADSALKANFANSVFMTCNEESDEMDEETICTTKTPRLNGPYGQMMVREYRVENRGAAGGTMIVVAQQDVAIMTSNTAGGLIEGVIQ